MTPPFPAPAEPPAEPLAFTIGEFCDAHRISRAMYFKEKRLGRTPREMHIGRRVVISREAAAEWRRAREAAG